MLKGAFLSMRRGTGLAGGVAAGVVGCVLALLTGLTRHMPLNAMGAIVLAGVSGLLNFSESAFLWRVRRLESTFFYKCNET